MAGKRMNLMFSSAVSDMKAMNSSFDAGELWIAYHGRNRNRTSISKKAFEAAIPSMYNCPIVCNYDRESDSIGAHDVEFVRCADGIRMDNITHPVGIVPESAGYRWRRATEKDGTEHEYLCVDFLAWKRQPAYRHIAENGITDESMEIDIKSGHTDEDGYYVIDEFEFQAFCLLESAPPCFESAHIEFSVEDDFREQCGKMVADLRKEFDNTIRFDIQKLDAIGGGVSALGIEKNDDSRIVEENEKDLNPAKFSMGDGEQNQGAEKPKDDAKNAGIDKYDENEESGTETDPGSGGMEGSTESVGTGTGDGAGTEDGGGEDDGNTDPPADDGDDDDKKRTGNSEYSLTAVQFVSEIQEALRKYVIEDPNWGKMTMYGYIDHDTELHEVYVINYMDWFYYGIPYTTSGDSVNIEFELAKKKKICFVDFEQGAEESGLCKFAREYAQWFSDIATGMKEELEALRKFKADIDAENAKKQIDGIFSRFEDLKDCDAFVQYRASIEKENYAADADEVERKCYELRGRNIKTKFSFEPEERSIRIPAVMTDGEKSVDAEEPYNGVFHQFGIR